MLKNSDILTGKHKLKKLFVKRGDCCHPNALFFFIVVLIILKNRFLGVMLLKVFFIKVDAVLELYFIVFNSDKILEFLHFQCFFFLF